MVSRAQLSFPSLVSIPTCRSQCASVVMLSASRSAMRGFEVCCRRRCILDNPFRVLDRQPIIV